MWRFPVAVFWSCLQVACSSPTAGHTTTGGTGGDASAGASAGDGVSAGAGGAGATCATCAGEGCREGQCVTEVIYQPMSSDNVVDFAVSSANLFWSNASGELLRSGLQGEDVTQAYPGGDRLLGLAADASNVYWMELTAHTVVVGDSKGDGGQVLAQLAGQPFDLAILDSKSLMVSLSDTGEILLVGRQDGKQQHLGSSEAGPIRVAAENDYVAWSNVTSGNVTALNRATGKIIAVATGQAKPTSILIKNGVVYWANPGDSAHGVMAKKLPDGDASPLALVDGVESIAVAGDYCYLAAGPAIFRTPLAGGTLQSIVTGYQRLGGLVATDQWLYYSDYLTGVIGRVAR